MNTRARRAAHTNTAVPSAYLKRTAQRCFELTLPFVYEHGVVHVIMPACSHCLAISGVARHVPAVILGAGDDSDCADYVHRVAAHRVVTARLKYSAGLSESIRVVRRRRVRDAYYRRGRAGDAESV